MFIVTACQGGIQQKTKTAKTCHLLGNLSELMRIEKLDGQINVVRDKKETWEDRKG